MMNTLFIASLVLVVLWGLGLVTSYTLGGGIHILLVLAAILFVVWVFTGKKKL
ncbi:MAG: lmo0937 family membrane protein [Spirochaetia bacterium]|nr:lmo0937 family membrane protein [Spirochaetia bacterium]